MTSAIFECIDILALIQMLPVILTILAFIEILALLMGLSTLFFDKPIHKEKPTEVQNV